MRRRRRRRAFLNPLISNALGRASIRSIAISVTKAVQHDARTQHRSNRRRTRRSRKFSRKFVEQIRFRSSFGRRGASGKWKATRCQNSSLLRPLANPKTSKKRISKNSIFFSLRNQFVVIYEPSSSTDRRADDDDKFDDDDGRCNYFCSKLVEQFLWLFGR